MMFLFLVAMWPFSPLSSLCLESKSRDLCLDDFFPVEFFTLNFINE